MSQSSHSSPLRYPGGKSFLSNYFAEIISLSDFNDVTYVEPFAGGAGAALNLLFLERVENIIINDMDKAIYSFWKSILTDNERFLEKLQKTRINVTEWKRQKKVYLDKTSKQFELGFATFYLNRCNRSGIIEAGPIGGYDQTGEWKIDARFNKADLLNRIEKISMYKKRITVTNKDGIDLVKDFGAKKANNYFIYFDPPYYVHGSSLYLNHYKTHDHATLAKYLRTRKKLPWIMTYDDVKEIRKLYPGYRKKSFTISHNANASKKGQELMIYSGVLELPKNSEKFAI